MKAQRRSAARAGLGTHAGSCSPQNVCVVFLPSNADPLHHAHGGKNGIPYWWQPYHDSERAHEQANGHRVAAVVHHLAQRRAHAAAARQFAVDIVQRVVHDDEQTAEEYIPGRVRVFARGEQACVVGEQESRPRAHRAHHRHGVRGDRHWQDRSDPVPYFRHRRVAQDTAVH